MMAGIRLGNDCETRGLFVIFLDWKLFHQIQFGTKHMTIRFLVALSMVASNRRCEIHDHNHHKTKVCRRDQRNHKWHNFCTRCTAIHAFSRRLSCLAWNSNNWDVLKMIWTSKNVIKLTASAAIMTRNQVFRFLGFFVFELGSFAEVARIRNLQTRRCNN